MAANIRELKEAVSAGVGGVEGVLHGQLSQAKSDTTKTNKPYYHLRLADVTDTLEVNAWNDSGAYQALATEVVNEGDFVELRGVFTPSDLGINAKDLQLRKLTGVERAAVLAGSETRAALIDLWVAEIEAGIGSIKDVVIRTLAQRLFKNAGSAFKRAAAAVKIHHNRRGGLLEHTASMLRMAKALNGCFPEANWDLVLFGVIFHDLGKVIENDTGEDGLAARKCITGELLGHVTIGTLVVSNDLLTLSREEPNLLEGRDFQQLRAHLLHLIVAHHGALEHGSPVEPRTMEAAIVHGIDMLDSRTEIIRAGLAADATGNDLVEPSGRGRTLVRSLKAAAPPAVTLEPHPVS